MRVVVQTIAEDYTWVSMVAEIGGYVGLLLGVAVLDCVHLIDSVWQRWNKRQKAVRMKNVETPNLSQDAVHDNVKV